jgi:uncharacterized protein YcbX
MWASYLRIHSFNESCRSNNSGQINTFHYSRRVLMVVNQEKNFVTARTHSEMLLVHPTVRNSVLTLKHPDVDPIHVNLAEVIIGLFFIE